MSPRNRPGRVELSYSPIDGAEIKRILLIMNTNTKSVTENQAFEALRLAQCHEHLGALASSAKLCAVDAEGLFNRGDLVGCMHRARESLRYSVGVFHPAYAKVA